MPEFQILFLLRIHGVAVRVLRQNTKGVNIIIDIEICMNTGRHIINRSGSGDFLVVFRSVCILPILFHLIRLQASEKQRIFIFD